VVNKVVNKKVVKNKKLEAQLKVDNKQLYNLLNNLLEEAEN